MFIIDAKENGHHHKFIYKKREVIINIIVHAIIYLKHGYHFEKIKPYIKLNK